MLTNIFIKNSITNYSREECKYRIYYHCFVLLINEFIISHLLYGGIHLYLLGWRSPLRLVRATLFEEFLWLPLRNPGEGHWGWRCRLGNIEGCFQSSLLCGLLSRDFHRGRAFLLLISPKFCFCNTWPDSPDSWYEVWICRSWWIFRREAQLWEVPIGGHWCTCWRWWNWHKRPCLWWAWRQTSTVPH